MLEQQIPKSGISFFPEFGYNGGIRRIYLLLLPMVVHLKDQLTDLRIRPLVRGLLIETFFGFQTMKKYFLHLFVFVIGIIMAGGAEGAVAYNPVAPFTLNSAPPDSLTWTKQVGAIGGIT